MEDKYTYFDVKQMMRSLPLSRELHRQARTLILERRVELHKVEVGYSVESSQLMGTANGIMKNGKWNHRIQLSFSKDRVLDARCDNFECYFYHHDVYGQPQLCVHELALLYLLVTYMETYNPGDSTDKNGAKLLDLFQQQQVTQTVAEATKEQEEIRLEPRLEKNEEGLKVSFRIGTNKLFVVKNMTDLVEHVEQKTQMELATTGMLDFMTQSFEETSKPWFSFIQEIVKEENYRKERMMSQSYYIDYRVFDVKNHVILKGKLLDDFYELAQGLEVEYTDKTLYSKKTKLSMGEGRPTIRLKIQNLGSGHSNDPFEGISVRGTVSELIDGLQYRYFIENNKLLRVKEEDIKEILPLLQMSKKGTVSFQVGRRQLSSFYYSLLPVFRKYGTVEEENAQLVEEYLPPEARFQFYLDMEQDQIVCQPKVLYGEQEESPLDVWRQGISWNLWRDKYKERSMMLQVDQIFPELNLQKDVFLSGTDEDDIFDIMEQGVERLMALGEVHSTHRFRNINVQKRPKITVGVSVESDLMNLSVMSEGISLEELLEALESYRKKKKYHRLKSGAFMPVQSEDMEVLNQMLETLHVTPKEFVQGKMEIPTYRALYLDKMLTQSDNVYTKRDTHFKKLIKEFKTIDDSEYEVPETLQSIMRNYQISGYRWLRTLASCGFGGILADDMGLGKTLQMISVLLASKNEGMEGVSLIVAPASLVYNWKEEFERFAPSLQVGLLVGTQKERTEKIKNYQNYDVLVTSYDLLKRDILEYEGCSFLYQILDEAQYIKNHATVAAKAVKVIRSKTRFALTGTPIENRLSELWSIFDYLMPGFLYQYEVFKRELETAIVKGKDGKATERLRKMVSPFILRRLKKDVLKDLPEKLEEVRYAKFDEKQRKLYDGQVVHMKQMLQQPDEEFQKSKIKILAELTRIRQICCDPSLLVENYTGSSAKREACMELVRNAVEGEHKVLIFSQFTSMLELLEQELDKEKITYYKITGETPKKTRLELVNQFNQNQVPVFLISLKAGGTGLNLTGADVVIHYDPWWNLAVQNQATDRAHRIGQEKIVVVYKLIVKDSIEEKIVNMQETKKDLAEEILSGQMGGLASLKKEELLELIGV